MNFKFFVQYLLRNREKFRSFSERKAGVSLRENLPLAKVEKNLEERRIPKKKETHPVGDINENFSKVEEEKASLPKKFSGKRNRAGREGRRYSSRRISSDTKEIECLTRAETPFVRTRENIVELVVDLYLVDPHDGNDRTIHIYRVYISISAFIIFYAKGQDAAVEKTREGIDRDRQISTLLTD